MSLVWTILIGLILGATAKMVMSRDIGNLLVIGVSGSVLAAGMQYAEGEPTSIVGSAMGAVLLLALYGVSATKYKREQARRHGQRRTVVTLDRQHIGARRNTPERRPARRAA
jgi:uncharacterized membrane protein YeaQ/YmgE (transglycosylase-associated protein family)